MRILLIDKETTTAKTLSESLGDVGFQIDEAEDLKDAEYFIDIRNYDLIVTMVEVKDYSDFITPIKHKSSRTAVVIVSENDSDAQEITALKAGADDYVRKPFDFGVLSARIEARLRFGGTSQIEIDGLVINPDEEKIIYKGQDIELKGKPFEVLTHLARHKDQIVSKEQLLDAIWEEPELVTPNVIEVAINQIRQKMDKPLNIATIETIRRRGYRFCYPKALED
jgi:two-component system OmpR family response regulator